MFAGKQHQKIFLSTANEYSISTKGFAGFESEWFHLSLSDFWTSNFKFFTHPQHCFDYAEQVFVAAYKILVL